MVLGIITCIILLISSVHIPDSVTYKAWNSGVATLTVGSVYKGVLDIYGTTNILIFVYFAVGSIFILAGFLLYVLRNKKNNCVIEEGSF